ncbi:MAG: 1-acyl-sn-glycerol-3-phosphate acyltransferase [Dehalococcoidia bacterium]|nr:1-acyl-sn-glycerol-3-phosphate acyltransferase [Dehalococcoidia bacterium]
MKQWLFKPCNYGFKKTLKWFSDLKIKGIENIPSEGPYIVAPNHISNLDPPIIASILPRPPVFLAKKELFSFPLVSFLLRSYGAYPIDRSGKDNKAITWVTSKLITDKKIAIMFPEGTRSKKGGLIKGQPGVSKLAIEYNLPIVPIALSGTENLQNPLRVLKPSAQIKLNIGKPFIVDKQKINKLSPISAVFSITNEIMTRISKMLPLEERGFYKDISSEKFSYTKEII